MKFTRSIIAVSSVLLFSACQDIVQPNTGEPLEFSAQIGAKVPGRYIVVLTEDAGSVGDAAGSLARTHSASVGFLYSHAIRGFVANMSDVAAARMAGDSRVAYVEQDAEVSIYQRGQAPPPSKGPGSGGGGGGSACADSPVYPTPWGITRVGGAADGSGLTAWIIDTGVDLDHCDLDVDAGRSRDFITSGRKATPDDQNGHGTHVAGTIAALDNGFGVVGVAAGATVVSVRVLDRRGSGTVSSVVAGIDYVAASGSPGDVANMSLGGGASQTLDDAVSGAASTGVKFAIAAGNSGAFAGNYSPARVDHPNVLTVSAVNSSDVFASFSNWGNPPVDFAAPGVSILSTWKDNGYNTINGTSMAAPHVAGVWLLGSVSSCGTAVGDPDASTDPDKADAIACR